MRLLGSASLGGFSRLGLAERCWRCLSSGCLGPWLSGRCWLSVLAAFAIAFACDLASRSSSDLATSANLRWLSFLLTAPASCPCFGLVSLAEYDHYLSITLLVVVVRFL